MENKETMNLQQKLIAISNEMPKLLKNRLRLFSSPSPQS